MVNLGKKKPQKKKTSTLKVRRSGQTSDLLDKIGFGKLTALNKLRIIICSIFILNTLAFMLAFLSDFRITVLFILISYLLLVILTVKILIIKKL